MKAQPLRNRNGNALLLTLILTATVAGLLGAGTLLTQGVLKNVDRTQDWRKAVAIAEAHVETAFAQWRDIYRDDPQKRLPWKEFKDIQPPDSALFPDSNYTLINYSVKTIKPTAKKKNGVWTYKTVGKNKEPDYAIGETPEVQSVYYIASADLYFPDLKKSEDDITNGNVRLRRVLEKKRENPWQYAIFFQDDCEMHPGPPQVVDGWVHTNSNLYTAHSSLTYEDKTSYVGDWELEYHPDDTQHTGTPASPNWPDDLPPAQGTPNEPLGFDSSEVFDTTDANPNNDGYVELIQPPDPNYPDPLANDEMRLWYQADLRIEVDAAHNLIVEKNDGTVINSGSTGADADLWTALQSAVTPGETIRDNRTEGDVELTSIDVNVLTTALGGGDAGAGIPDLSGYNWGTVGDRSDANGWDGIIYIRDSSANPSADEHRGIRLRNGGVLPDNTRASDGSLVGLTVISENPVYIQGDYNSGYDGTNEPRSNTHNDFEDNTVSGYDLRPAAVIADAVNILSNSWNDANSDDGVGSRVASNTTVNSAIVSGNVPTGETDDYGDYVTYSGGVENFPRFLEKWSGVYFTYHGSMIQVFQSEQAFYRWGKGNVYNPPKRQWFFEDEFLNNPPPGFIYLISYERQRWFLE